MDHGWGVSIYIYIYIQVRGSRGGLAGGSRKGGGGSIYIYIHIYIGSVGRRPHAHVKVQ